MNTSSLTGTLATWQEDLCILLPSPADGKLRLVAGLVSFPMRWSLLDKMGHEMHRIHKPVPFYQVRLCGCAWHPETCPCLYTRWLFEIHKKCLRSAT